MLLFAELVPTISGKDWNLSRDSVMRFFTLGFFLNVLSSDYLICTISIFFENLQIYLQLKGAQAPRFLHKSYLSG